jgi:hypothetical protein
MSAEGSHRGRVHLLYLGSILILAAALRLAYLTQPLIDWFTWREASTGHRGEYPSYPHG